MKNIQPLRGNQQLLLIVKVYSKKHSVGTVAQNFIKNLFF